MNDIKRFESHKSLNITLLKYERRRFLCFLFVLIFGFISNSILAQTISTDKLDYAPGETVRITGTGWMNDDVIILHIVNETNPVLNSTEHYLSWEVNPINGNLSSTWNVTQDELNTSLILTAEGKESGLKYKISFTDDSHLIMSGKVQLANGTGISGSTINAWTNSAHNTGNVNTTSAADGTWSLTLNKATTYYVVVTPPACYSSSDVTLGTNPGTISKISINEIQIDGGTNGGTSTGNLFILILNQNTITAPATTTFCATSSGSDITIIGSNLGTGATYQWQQCTDPSNLDTPNAYSNISGATSKDYNPGTITATRGYRRVSSSCSSISNIVKMFVTPGISGNTITPSTPTNNCGPFYANYINGSNPSGGNNNTFTFQWQSSTDGVNYSNITGVTGEHYYFPGQNATSTIYFRRIVYSGYCTSYSNVLFYNTQSTISGTLTVNAGSTTQLTGSPSGGTWSSATPSVATVNSSTGLVLGVSAGTSIITYTTTAGCSSTATVTVNSVSTTPTVTSFNPASSCSGSGASVVITGTNFTGATAVNFNGLSAASYTINSSTQITATLPAVAITGPISVTTPSGTGTSSSNFTVNALPIAVAVSGNGTYCGSTTIAASGGTGGTIYYQGTTSGGTSTATASSSQSITTSGTYYFRSQSASGCWGPEGSATVTINTLPVPYFTDQPSSSECQGDDVDYTTLSGMTNYIWWVPVTSADYSITSGGIDKYSNTVTLKWLTTGNKTVTVGYTDAVNGCASATPASSTITVNPTPVIGTFN